jgi:hypothetical protein
MFLSVVYGSNIFLVYCPGPRLCSPLAIPLPTSRHKLRGNTFYVARQGRLRPAGALLNSSQNASPTTSERSSEA